MSSTNIGSILSSLQAALLVLEIYYMGELFHNGRGHIVGLKTNTYIYIYYKK